jgi:hypothetical protein
MSDTDEGGHGAAAHGTGHGTGHDHDEHGHAEDALGPIDWAMWTSGVLGVLFAAVMLVAFVMGTGNNFGLP